MKTPRRKHYNTQRDESDVCSRELGPLEIGELETPKERRSAPVAAVRYLAGSKFQANSPEESEYTENSDYTDARSENSEDFVDAYKSGRSKYQVKKHSRRYGELRQESQDSEQVGHHQPQKSNFAREFKLKYGANVTSNLQYYHTARATQDTFLQNMDYIHSQFTNFNPNFINFNYGHFSYPNYGGLKNRTGEYYSAQNPPMYTSIHHRPMPEYGYQRSENMLPLNHDYYSRYDPQYMRPQWNYNHMSQGYMRGGESSRSSNMLGDYTPRSQNRCQDASQQYQCTRHSCNSSHHDSSYDHKRGQCEHGHQHDSHEYHHHAYKREHRDKHRGNDYSQSDLNRRDEETMKLAIENAVKNAFDSYIKTNKLKEGDETCYTDPAPAIYAFEKSDETLTSHHQDQMYGENEIQKVMDDVDSLTNNDMNESDVKTFAKYEGEKAEGYKKEKEDQSMNRMYMSQLTDYNDLSENKYDHVDLFMTKSTTLYEVQSSKMKESQSLGDTIRYGTEEECGKGESARKEIGSRQGSKGIFKHVDLFNNDEESHDDQYTEERMTNRDDEEDEDSAVMGGSTYEVEATMEATGYYQGSDYQDTSYYPSSSFNLNTFNSFSCLRSSSSKMDMKDDEGEENINGTTLSTSDLIESRTNLQTHNDEYEGDYDGNYSGDHNRNDYDGSKGINDTATSPPNKYGEAGGKYELMNHWNGERNANGNTNNKKAENREIMLSKTEESEEETMETYTQNRPNKSENTSGLRGTYTGLFYQSQTQSGKITSEHQKSENVKNNSNYSTAKRSHPRNIDGVSHICSRIEQLEESLRRIESHLRSKPEEKNETRKSIEFKLEGTKAKPPPANTQMDQVSELELMEGYKAASMIKKLLHVKSMDSLIPAFTAFVKNRMA
ncbi:conserved hypothetical protein [Theileria orientalis strain Shintoku]|uniref:Uncharacterized protein n=1 Tax=Theileria orientalis strain Shintoku TaxID=869250 RepID=J4CCS2_THEOR|nr:conserved hypothetical protein [Theileria orientalis strain Shintoku]PVC53940.1 hypothetical protein MACL_00003421 [Theileria orientalis]BAM39887.1 conserved hypothetical protein [Theileria orientalis strain Shintoku]|eukprot:XP_009690188.1 conserved hypothetical protein [Theileria orientalis strain Shintoku]